MARINLSKMSYRDLVDLQDAIAAALIVRKDGEKAELKRKLAALAGEAGFALDDLLGSQRGRKAQGPNVVKYRNPKDGSQTWTGRGRKPNWLVEALSKGQKIETFAVA